jgi:hypothetical protein
VETNDGADVEVLFCPSFIAPYNEKDFNDIMPFVEEERWEYLRILCGAQEPYPD